MDLCIDYNLLFAELKKHGFCLGFSTIENVALSKDQVDYWHRGNFICCVKSKGLIATYVCFITGDELKDEFSTYKSVHEYLNFTDTIEAQRRPSIIKAFENVLFASYSDAVATKKNESQVRRCKNLLLNGPNMIELPANLNGLLRMEDVSSFHAERYYLGKTQWDLFEKIKRGVAVTLKLMEYGIPYKNSTLIYGVPGTGKTEFARYVAYSLGIPYAYINFSFLIDSFMGNTSKNIQRVFDFCKGQKCVLMLDEIDCIGLKRGIGGNGGPDGEISRTTISLMQALDDLTDGQIIIAATNRYDLLDPALSRRFQNHVEFRPFNFEENREMMEKFLAAVDESLLSVMEIVTYARENHTQAEVTGHLIEVLTRKVSQEVDVEAALEALKSGNGRTDDWEKLF